MDTEAKELREARAKALEASDDPKAAAFNAGYDDYPEDQNPFEPGHRLYQYYEYGQLAAKPHAEENALLDDDDLIDLEDLPDDDYPAVDDDLDFGFHDDREYFADIVFSEPDPTPTAPPPDDAEALRLMRAAFEKAPRVSLDIGAFEAFNLVGLLQLCLRHPQLPPNQRAMAAHLVAAFEEVVLE